MPPLKLNHKAATTAAPMASRPAPALAATSRPAAPEATANPLVVALGDEDVTVLLDPDGKAVLKVLAELAVDAADEE